MNEKDDKLSACLLRVAETSGLGEWSKWTKRDFEQLSNLIEQKTGILLSSSTLIRLYKGDRSNRPQRSTLDALARFIGFESWYSFSSPEDISGSDQQPSVKPANAQPFSKTFFAVLASVFILATIIGLMKFFSQWSVDPAKVSFSILNPEMTGVPATIQVEYNIEKYKPDSLWLQLYWNPEEKVRLNSREGSISTIYYYPGVHSCLLVADNEVIGNQKVRIFTTGWTAMIRHTGLQLIPIYIRNSVIIHDGALQVTEGMVNTQNLRPNSNIITSYYYVNDLGSITSDDYTLTGRIRNPPTTLGTQPCGFCTVQVISENGKHFFTIGDSGCSGVFVLSFSGSDRMDDHPNLSAFEVSMADWINFTSVVKGHTVSVFLGENQIYSSDLVTDVGKILGVHLYFSGLGAIDQVRLYNSNNYIAIDEDFE